jgi:[glutamine synthetase] adenylyltransferase / [glutamine synthetase]-adenylyl-L-tyrosine phosphorylase
MIVTPSEKKAAVLKLASALPSELVSEHFKRLDADYFNEFTPEEIIRHLVKLADTDFSKGFNFDLLRLDEFSYSLTAIGQDLPGFFTALTGLVASYDFDIRLGKVFSYTAFSDGRIYRGKIIDYLVLQHPQVDFLTEELRNRFLHELNHLVALLQNRQTQDLRIDLYHRIGAYLSRNDSGHEISRLPLDISIDYDDRQTILTIRGTDRKALLFSLANALMLQGVSIQKLLTKSEAGKSGVQRFEDRIFIVDAQGRPITDQTTLERLKVAIVLMERFTSILSEASDYSTAVETFNEFIDALMEKSAGRPDLPTFEDYSILSSLAKILGAGPYLWEELIKIPLPDLKILLQELGEGKKNLNRAGLEKILKANLDRTNEYVEKKLALNRFKDYQLFRIDINYLIYPHNTLQEFSSELTDLAEVTLDAALWLAYDKLCAKFGEPKIKSPSNEKKTASPCHFGLFAQGKLGGRELGYASDLELQLLYGNAGETEGPETSISHAEFFSLLVQEIRTLIETRKEGIFELDLRLRPHGDAGPLATSIDLWVDYYGEDGGALDFERQALLKLRPVAATPGFGDRVMKARDALVFGENEIAIKKTLELRVQQMVLKTKGHGPKAINAKYSPGGLVEVEYAVQFLQLQHGRKIAALREANTEKALEILLAEGILSPEEFEKLYRGYVLLRRLINALRMVRGHSRDLFVPVRESPEYLHLAKRMGYITTSRFEPDSQLDWELQHTLQDVHVLFGRRFLGLAASESDAPSLTSVLLKPNSDFKAFQDAMERLGLAKVKNANVLIQRLFDTVKEKGLLCAALVVSEVKLRSSPDPEAVIRYLGQFLEILPDPDYFLRQMLNHPHLHEILIKAFGHSDFLTDILLRQPDYLLGLGNTRSLEKPKLYGEFRKEVEDQVLGTNDLEVNLDNLRRYRNREYLRIGLRDIYLGESLQRITAEISHLSNAIIDCIYELTMIAAGTVPWREAMAVIALGKLGGNELNYSSDIDIVFVFDPKLVDGTAQAELEKWGRLFIACLSLPGTQGKLFRVDTQLRPYGGQSPLIGSTFHYQEYFQKAAAGWELQSWLKARSLAGSPGIAASVILEIQSLAVSPANREKIEISMRQVRKLGLEKLRSEDRLFTEVKLGPGGIRTIEFYVQYLQILNGEAMPELISGNTLSVLGRLFRYRLISHNYYDLLSKSYIFLRRIEHALQLQGLQQRHELPASMDELEKLAKRMGFEEKPGQSATAQFKARYRQHMLTLLELSSSLFGYETNIPGDSQESK